MKIQYITGILIGCLLAAGCAPTIGNLPEVVPARLGLIDSKTYTDYLEANKGHDRLADILESELRDIELTENNVRDGIFLAQWEKETINDVFSRYGSENPLDDFFKMRQVDTERKTYDPEGKLYILDDLASLYTYHLVDFTKARHYQDRTKQLYRKLRQRNIDNVLLSDFYNNRRSLFYHFFYRMEDAVPDDFTLFPERIDLITPFPQSYLTHIRKLDFEAVGQRINERDFFLKQKLGETAAVSGQRIHFSGKTHLKRFNEMTRLIAANPQYDSFQANYLITENAYGAYRISGSNAYLEKIIEYGQKALSTDVARTFTQQNNINKINYWLGLALLKKKAYAEGGERMEAFLKGIDRYERLAENAFQSRQDVVAQANSEALTAAKTRAMWQKAFVVALMAGSAYMSATAQAQAAAGERSAVSAQSVEQGFYNNLPAFRSLYKDSDRIVQDARKKGALRAEVAKYITPYSLKVNRYLNKFEMVDFFLELGKGYEATGRPQDALSQYEEAVKIIERQRSTIFTENQRISFFSAKQALYSRIITLLTRLKQPEKGIEYVERSKSRAFVDLLGSTRLKLKTMDQTRRYEDTFRTQAEIDTLLSDNNIGMAQIDAVYEKARAIAIEKQPSPKAASDLEILSLSTVQTLKADEIKQLADLGTVILEYYISDNHLILFQVRNNKVRAVEIPIDLDKIRYLADRFRKDIINRRDNAAVAKQLYDYLIAPAKEIVAANHLIIIPHGPLHYLPFQALYDGNRYLIERYAISYAPSATVLKFTEAKAAMGNNRMLIAGNPTLDLAFAEKEAKSIAAIFPDTTLLSRKKATESYIKGHGGEFDFIHLATHGEYNETMPLQSRILLGSDDKNDGFLTMAELFSLKWQADLVSLSACETGLSKHKSGDELIGLQRGLMFAGTRSVLSSLWPVDDEATGVLMTAFYKHLKTLPKRKALQKAQVETMQAFGHPYFWAAFNLSGAGT